MIFCILGKSASGKDSIYRELIEDPELGLIPVIPYTTRPMREGEREGGAYHFVDRAGMEAMLAAGKVIERRSYQTTQGIWDYFTADDGSLAPDQEDYLLISTPEAYGRIRSYYGPKRVCPIYLCLDDGERLARALTRERQQRTPDYAELCRRYLADEEDFSEDRLQEAGISDRFENLDLKETKRQIAEWILSRGKKRKGRGKSLCDSQTSSVRKI